MRFFKNASKRVIQGQEKKLVRSWEGAPKKMCSHPLKKKMEVESKKLKNKGFRPTSTWNEKLVNCVFAVKHADVT